MTPASDVLEHAARVLSELPGGPPLSLSDDELLHHAGDVEALGRLVDSLRVEVAAEVDRRSDRVLGDAGLARRHYFPTGTQLLESITRVTRAEASRRVHVGSATAPRVSLLGELMPARFETIGTAITSGDLGLDSAAAIIRQLTDASRTASADALAAAEEQLVAIAAVEPADTVAKFARAICAHLDPDGVEPREDQLRELRRFHLGREVDGLTPFSGLADPVNAALLRAALSERTAPSRQPRFLDAADLDAPDLDAGELDAAVVGSGNAEAADMELDLAPADRRSREQRAFDVVFGLLTAGIRADNKAVGSLHGTATVSVVISAGDLVRGTGAAWIDDVLSPVSTATTREIICDGGVRLQIEGRRGEILWEGVRERYFTAAQRRALAVRDGGCIWPQCTAPPSWCHAHHVVEWEHGGLTDVDNGALLCSFHHHLLHSSAFELRMNAGCPELLAPSWLDHARQWRPVTKSRLKLAKAA